MIPSNTICVSQEGPANALALNKDCSQVVIAGRNVFKVFAIGENEFTEVCNLRVGKNLNLNFSSIDVAWSSIEENTLATAATNGAVVVWNLGRSGRSKQEHVFSDHKRTVNKVSFHLTDPALLISGSQDGMMKCFDLRMKEVARTFISNTESIRDVQFSPAQAHTFAAVSENGSVQLWDVRRHERCLAQFTAHSGPVFACDWHPAAPWLATASRDKTIKVWDIHAKPSLEHTIYTIASVGHVKWRPQKKYQVASCALVLDCAVHVWDVRRPHVPLATFAEHRDVTTAIAWLRAPHSFLSTSRDCGLYRHRWSEAAHPVLWANPQGVCVSARGDVAHAAPERPLPAPAVRADPAAAAAAAHPPPHTLGRKQPTAGSLSSSAQAALERLFPCGAGARLVRHAAARGDPVLACARAYRLRGAPPARLAAHNAAVARQHARHLVALVWDVVALIASESGARAAAADGGGGGGGRAAAAVARVSSPPPPAPPPPPAMAPAREDWGDCAFHNSGVLGLPTCTIYVPPDKYAPATDDDDAGWVSAASAHYVDVEAADWTLPEEAFPLRTAPPPPAPPDAPPPPDDRDEDPSPAAAAAAAAAPPSAPLSRQASSVGETGVSEQAGTALHVRAGVAAARAGVAAGAALAAALRRHAALGDVQTPAAVLLVLHHHRAILAPYIDDALQEAWLVGYMEQLSRGSCWTTCAEVARAAGGGGAGALGQLAAAVCVSCARCGRRTRPARPCERCRVPRPALPLAPLVPPAHYCAVCHEVVRGLYAWCQGCAHGGHLEHMRQWMAAHRLCPAGCGHQCQ